MADPKRELEALRSEGENVETTAMSPHCSDVQGNDCERAETHSVRIRPRSARRERISRRGEMKEKNAHWRCSVMEEK